MGFANVSPWGLVWRGGLVLSLVLGLPAWAEGEEAVSDSGAIPVAASTSKPGDPTAALPTPPKAAPAETKAAPKPRLAIGNDEYYVKPILAIAAGLHGEQPLDLPAGATLEARLTTFALTRFGLEGRLGPYVTFKSEFERNMKAHGSGVWEGTAAFSVREQVLRIARWGAAADVGIIVDLGSVDFMTVHAADALLADKYTRDPLLFTGFNRGQGVMASYSWKGLRGSFSYTAGNPLSTSTSYQVGGNFGNAGRFWEQPLGRFDAGHQPSDVFHFTVLSPSLAFTHDVIEARAAAQFFSANTDTTSTVDPRISGYNLRAGVAGKIRGTLGIPFMVKPFVNVARVTNRAKNNDSSHSNELLSNPYTALTISGGIDLMLWERSGIGFSYVRTMDRSPQYLPGGSEVFEDTAQDYLNIGVTYWITDETAVGARFARWTKLQTSRTSEQTLWSDQSFFLSLRVHL